MKTKAEVFVGDVHRSDESKLVEMIVIFSGEVSEKVFETWFWSETSFLRSLLVPFEALIFFLSFKKIRLPLVRRLQTLFTYERAWRTDGECIVEYGWLDQPYVEFAYLEVARWVRSLGVADIQVDGLEYEDFLHARFFPRWKGSCSCGEVLVYAKSVYAGEPDDVVDTDARLLQGKTIRCRACGEKKSFEELSFEACQCRWHTDPMKEEEEDE